MIQATWLSLTWQMEPKKIKLLEQVSISKTLKTEEKETKDGQNPSNTQGYEPQNLDFTYKVNKLAGIDPLQEYERAARLIGKKGPLYLAGAIFGPKVMLLDSVEFTGEKMTPKGKILTGQISLKFTEEINKQPAPLAAMEPYCGASERGSIPGLAQKATDGSAYDVRPSAAAVAAKM